MRKKMPAFSTLVLCICATACLAVFATSESYRSLKPTPAAGGGPGSSASYELASLVGQTAIDRSVSAGYVMDHGFYSRWGAPYAEVGEMRDSPPGAFKLGAVYPNPFNPATTIAYEVPSPGHVHLAIYNMKGQKVRTLVDQNRPIGRHDIVWRGEDDNGGRAASGLYLLKMTAGGYAAQRKITLLK